MKLLMVLLLFFSWQAGAENTDEKPTTVVISGTEILLFDIEQNTHGVLALSEGKNITQRTGYDNQPKFSNDGGLLYYTRAVNTDQSTQMDIYQYDIATGQTQPYMTTALSEYSATPMADNPNISVVQVDEQGNQYVVILDQSASVEKQMQRYSDLKQVGYFNWTVDGSLWSFILNDNNGGDLYLQKTNTKAQKLSENVGRAFITDQKQMRLYYVDKNTTPWRIHMRKTDGTHEDVMSLPMGVEDFTLDSAGRFWAGRDNTLYVSTDQRRWYIIAEFNDQKLHQITRLTTSPKADKIAIVFAEKNKSK